MEIEDIIEQATLDVQDFYTKNPLGVVIIRGATATGKSKLSILLAKNIPCEIISADSRQFFKYMDIGTDKVSQEIREKIPHHLIDSITPEQSYTAGQWKEEVTKLITEIHQRNKLPIIVGGTGLYIDTIYKNFSLPESAPNRELRKKLEQEENESPGILYKKLQEIDPEEAQKHHPNSIRYIIRALEIYDSTGKTKTEGFFPNPVQWPLFMIGLRRDREETNKRINARIKEMFKQGLIDEVKSLLEKGYDPQLQSMQGIGYKEVVNYLQGKYDLEKCDEILKRNSHHLAKKQRTRFRRYIAEGKGNPKENVTYKLYEL